MTMPADVAIRADAELGRALRRVMEALPKSDIQLEINTYANGSKPEVWCIDDKGDASLDGTGNTIAEALTALADVLEAR